jgi:hypothetical protein
MTWPTLTQYYGAGRAVSNDTLRFPLYRCAGFRRALTALCTQLLCTSLGPST